jgi:hypothetical protein
MLQVSSESHLSFISVPYIVMRGHAVAHLVEALRYKPKRRGLDFR